MKKQKKPRKPSKYQERCGLTLVEIAKKYKGHPSTYSKLYKQSPEIFDAEIKRLEKLKKGKE